MTWQEPTEISPVGALTRIGFLLEAKRAPTYRVRAFRRAAAALSEMDPEVVRRLAAAGRLRELSGVGEVIERVVLEALRGETPAYLRRLEEEGIPEPAPRAAAIREALRGDCHVHSEWSDGGSPVAEMAEAARDLGLDYMALTDHSPRLTVANGLSPERLREQLALVEEVNGQLAPFRILTGIEVDILEDGSLDQEEDLLARLDIVVGSVHSKLRSDSETMTRRMVAGVANPHLDILGHCTGRIVVGRGRPQSTFDAEIVFAALAHFDKALELNSRPERLDPPGDLLALALESGCRFAIDTDAHAPGQLTWLRFGCEMAAAAGIPTERIVNTMTAEALVGWTHGR